MGWLTGWNYRKSHVINYAAGAGTLYQKQITVHYGSGTDSDDDVYLNSHCRTDFGDVRFTDDDGSTLLDCWMESKVDSDYAIFWVEVADDLSTVNQTIYVYYGKSDASYPYLTDARAHGSATFIFFDDFDDGIISGWDNVVGLTDANEDAGVLTFPSDQAYDYEISMNLNVQNFEIFVKVKPLTGGQDPAGYSHVHMFFNSATNFWYLQQPEFYAFYKIVGGSATAVYYNLDIVTVSWYTNQVRRDAGEWWLFRNGVQQWTGFDAWLPSTPWRFGYRHKRTEQVQLDLIWMRKFVDPEPTHGAWGSEETAPPPPPWGGSALPQLQMAKAILGL